MKQSDGGGGGMNLDRLDSDKIRPALMHGKIPLAIWQDHTRGPCSQPLLP